MSTFTTQDTVFSLPSVSRTCFILSQNAVSSDHFEPLMTTIVLVLTSSTGFPFETTVAVSRLIVSGTLDRFPNLRLLVAHAGAAMPSLVGRLDSCVAHDIAVSNRLQHTPTDYFKRLYFDAIAYSDPSMDCLIQFVGQDRIMFGTDNPFFPPPPAKGTTGSTIDEHGKSSVHWPSTMKVYKTMQHLDQTSQEMILRSNAIRILNLK